MITVVVGQPIDEWGGTEDEWHFLVGDGIWLTDDEARELGVLQ